MTTASKYPNHTRALDDPGCRMNFCKRVGSTSFSKYISLYSGQVRAEFWPKFACASPEFYPLQCLGLYKLAENLQGRNEKTKRAPYPGYLNEGFPRTRERERVLVFYGTFTHFIGVIVHWFEIHNEQCYIPCKQHPSQI